MDKKKSTFTAGGPYVAPDGSVPTCASFATDLQVATHNFAHYAQQVAEQLWGPRSLCGSKTVQEYDRKTALIEAGLQAALATKDAEIQLQGYEINRLSKLGETWDDFVRMKIRAEHAEARLAALTQEHAKVEACLLHVAEFLPEPSSDPARDCPACQAAREAVAALTQPAKAKS